MMVLYEGQNQDKLVRFGVFAFDEIYGTFNAYRCWHVRVLIDCHLKKQMMKREIYFDIEIYNAKKRFLFDSR